MPIKMGGGYVPSITKIIPSIFWVPEFEVYRILPYRTRPPVWFERYVHSAHDTAWCQKQWRRSV